MKKILSITLAFLAGIGLLACTAVRAEETTTMTTTPATTIPETTTTLTQEGIVGYTYVNVEDLIDQLYADVYEQIYSELYAELSASLTADLDEAVYQAVLEKIQEKIDSGEIAVPLETFQEQIDSVVALASKSVVGVTTYSGTEAQSLGSGVLYHYSSANHRYYLITNHHVIDGGDNYKVVFEDGSSVTATLLGSDADVDIAVLSFSSNGLFQDLEVSPLGDSDLLTKGRIVLACGNPQGYDFFGSVTMGVVSGTNRTVGTDSVLYIQHDASINAGNSGGPLYNLAGEVVGINVSKYASTEIEGMGFAIPINTALEVVQSIAPGTVG